MHIDFKKLSAAQTYFTLIQTVIPRPIAWVLTENESKDYNVAPFSYFTAVSSDPALLMFSIGKKKDSDMKDTLRNIRDRNQFVIHIADINLADQVNQSAKALPYGESELNAIGLETTMIDNFPIPRISKAKVAFACSLYDIKEIGNTPMSMVFAEIEHAVINDEIITENDNRYMIESEKLNPLSRLGGNDYAELAKPFTLSRP